VLIGTAVIHNASADIDTAENAAVAPPAPPCLTTNLCFENAIKATNFTSASAIAVGYLNDGDNLDFVTTGWSRDRIRIKAGLGDGTFWGTWTKNMGDGTYEVDIADFNDDGHPDIIATNSEQDRVYIRWGLTGWTTASFWATDDHPHYIATGDFNNDGLDDFATGNTTLGSETITVRLRQDGGGFAPGTHYPASEFLSDVAFNDCDHDGDLDMFYSAYFADPYHPESFVYLRRNDGFGIFLAPQPIAMDSQGVHLDLGSLAFGDLNEDGWDDMISTRSDHKLVRALGGVNCSFHDPIVSDVSSNPYSLEIADMNGDGHLDLVLSHLLNQLITIYLGQGNGNMVGPYTPDLTLDWHVRDIGVGDFNNDGLMDIVYAEESGVWLLLAREPDAPPWELPWLMVNGIPFAPTGKQTYTINNTIIINGIGSSGEDGVDALLDSAERWSTDIDLEGHNGAKLYLDTIANETVANSVGLISTQSGMEIWPIFNPTTYRIEYLLDDQVQLALTLPSNGQTPAAVVNWDEIWCIMNQPSGEPSEICQIIYQTGIYGDMDDGISDIGIWVPAPLMITAANGNLVTADHIRLVEIPDGPSGSAKNGFSRVEIRGAVLDSLTLSNVMMESAEPPLPDPPAPSYGLYLPLILR
jgi:hypothetical protein